LVLFLVDAEAGVDNQLTTFRSMQSQMWPLRRAERCSWRPPSWTGR